MSMRNMKGFMGLLLFGVGVVLISLAAGNVGAATLTVDDDGSAEYTSIQDAIDNATNGDTISVWEGTYSENVVVDKSVSLVGNGSEVTTIDGGGSGDVVKITVNRCNVSGFRVTGGDNFHAGIQINSDYNTIDNNNCSDNKFLAINLDTSSHNNISNNSCVNNTNGISIISSNYNTIFNNLCSNKYQAIHLFSSDFNTVSHNICLNNNIDLFSSNNNIISSNICSSENDNGISLTGSDHNIVSNNTCNSNSVGIFFNSSDNNIITNNTCINNTSGMYFSGSDHNIISNNTCSNSLFNGILLSVSNNNQVSNNKFFFNGAGIRLTSNSQNNTIHYNNICNNIDYGMNATNNKGCTVNATDNWWGDNSGPYHPVNNTNGKGDNITDYVAFDPWIIKKANEIPMITISTPANNSKVSGIVTFSGIANDPDGTIHNVEVSIDDGDWINATGTTEWSYTWDSNDLVNGEHIIRIRSSDGTNYSKIDTISVKVENKDDEDSEGSGFIPGFGAAAVVGAIGFVLTLTFKKRKKEE